ncbi:MAG: CHAD domain-containing protein [Thermoplasmata archaeon]|nr:CHAD domain-containing protein [Thermoplasmata archaeon]MCI4359624.1 CHAD domain-containing protein [Thermoplasmata archaeon]
MVGHRGRADPIGSPGTGAASDSAPTPGRFTLASASRKVVESARRDADRISIEPDPTPEQLHRFHQRLRRLRASIRLLARLLPEAQADRALEIHRRLRRVARLVGEVRDFDVAIAHLSDPRLSVAAEPPDERLEGMLRRMGEEAGTGRALLGAFLRSEIDRGLFEESDRLVATAGARLDGAKAWTACRRAVTSGRSRVERSLRRARRRSNPDRMHRLRIELRRAHILSDLVDAAVGRVEPSFPARLSGLQRSLGALHDLDLLVDGFEDVRGKAARSPWVRREDQRRRALRKEIILRFRKRSTRAAIASLAL